MKNDIVLFSLVNNSDVLERNLRASPAIIHQAVELTCLRNTSAASAAYADAMAGAKSGVVCFAHQDVYLPGTWLARLCAAISQLTEVDPNWAVLGCYGVKKNGDHVGEVWDSGLDRVIGRPFAGVQEVHSVDELFFVARADVAGLFDPLLPDFHLYGTDIVMNARAIGRKSYVAHVPVVHNSRRVTNLGGGYTSAYRYMARKWAKFLPLQNTIVPVTYWGIPLYVKRARMGMMFGFGSDRPPNPVADPRTIARNFNWE